MQAADQFIQVGQVLKSYGTDGSVVIRLFDDYFESLRQSGDSLLFSATPFWLFFDGLPVPFFAEITGEKAGGKPIVRLTGTSSLEDADEIAGKSLYLEVSAEDSKESASFLDMDFSGWTVCDSSSTSPDNGADNLPGRLIGTVLDMEDIPGNPLLTVRTSSGNEVLIPLHEDLVTSVDPDKKILGISLPEGLIEIY